MPPPAPDPDSSAQERPREMPEAEVAAGKQVQERRGAFNPDPGGAVGRHAKAGTPRPHQHRERRHPAKGDLDGQAL